MISAATFLDLTRAISSAISCSASTAADGMRMELRTGRSNELVATCDNIKISSSLFLGWGNRLIGFREVILATENIQTLDDPVKVLRWIFKVYDFDAKGYIPVTDIESIVQQIIRCLVFSMTYWTKRGMQVTEACLSSLQSLHKHGRRREHFVPPGSHSFRL